VLGAVLAVAVFAASAGGEHTDEKLVSADTDAFRDIYERSGGQTTLISTGGNGAEDANLPQRVGRWGARVVFTAFESLVSRTCTSRASSRCRRTRRRR
jgi:hypothetical protein